MCVRSSRLDSRVRLLANRRLDLLELRPVASSCGCGNARVVEVQELAQRVDRVADVSAICTAGRERTTSRAGAKSVALIGVTRVSASAAAESRAQSKLAITCGARESEAATVAHRGGRNEAAESRAHTKEIADNCVRQSRVLVVVSSATKRAAVHSSARVEGLCGRNERAVNCSDPSESNRGKRPVCRLRTRSVSSYCRLMSAFNSGRGGCEKRRLNRFVTNS